MRLPCRAHGSTPSGSSSRGLSSSHPYGPYGATWPGMMLDSMALGCRSLIRMECPGVSSGPSPDVEGE
jgi:hypothetical protein